MGNTGFRFDSRQQYQLDAIAAVVDLFDGQPKDADKLAVTMRGTVGETAEGQLAVDTAQEIGAIGNNLVLDEAAILANLQAVQDRNGLEQSASLAGGKRRPVSFTPPQSIPAQGLSLSAGSAGGDLSA